METDLNNLWILLGPAPRVKIEREIKQLFNPHIFDYDPKITFDNFIFESKVIKEKSRRKIHAHLSLTGGESFQFENVSKSRTRWNIPSNNKFRALKYTLACRINVGVGVPNERGVISCLGKIFRSHCLGMRILGYILLGGNDFDDIFLGNNWGGIP